MSPLPPAFRLLGKAAKSAKVVRTAMAQSNPFLAGLNAAVAVVDAYGSYVTCSDAARTTVILRERNSAVRAELDLELTEAERQAELKVNMVREVSALRVEAVRLDLKAGLIRIHNELERTLYESGTDPRKLRTKRALERQVLETLRESKTSLEQTIRLEAEMAPGSVALREVQEAYREFLSTFEAIVKETV